jgi:hypothetical protein
MTGRIGLLLTAAALFSASIAQDTSLSRSSVPAPSSSQPAKVTFDYVWINGGMGAGGVISTNIINSGALLPFYAEFCLQKGRTRIGFGVCDEIYITPENLGKLLFGNSSNVEKYYLTWEWMLIPNFPVNLGPCAQIGIFLVGNDIKKANAAAHDTIKVTTSNFFANAGLNLEVGIRPIFLFVKPWFEFKSYGSFHKELIGCVSFGLKYKLMTAEEKARRAAEKAAKAEKKRKNR